MTASATRPPQHTARLRGRMLIQSEAFAVALMTIVPLAAAALLFPGTDTVDLTFVNPTVYDIRVSARGADDEGWMVIGAIEHDESRVFPGVYDHGDRWIFHFSGQGRDAGELQISRQQLDAAEWTLEIPPRVGKDLHDQGAPPAPDY